MPTKVSLYYKNLVHSKVIPTEWSLTKPFCRGHMIKAFVEKMVSRILKVCLFEKRVCQNHMIYWFIQQLSLHPLFMGTCGIITIHPILPNFLQKMVA